MQALTIMITPPSPMHLLVIEGLNVTFAQLMIHLVARMQPNKSLLVATHLLRMFGGTAVDVFCCKDVLDRAYKFCWQCTY